MATRQQWQIAQDLVRFVNVVNDLLDNASYILREIDVADGSPLIDAETGQPFTLGELKGLAANIRSGILGYWSTIDTFITVYGPANVATALNLMGISATAAKAELDDMKNVIQTATTQVQAASTKAELALVADYIDANSIKLPLVRRPWNI